MSLLLRLYDKWEILHYISRLEIPNFSSSVKKYFTRSRIFNTRLEREIVDKHC